MKKIAAKLLEFYQAYLSFDRGILALLAPGGACKYEVSCSEYTNQSVKKYGVVQGGWMGLKRIWSCR